LTTAARLTNYTIDGVGYPYPHRSNEGAIEKARQIIDRDYWFKVQAAVEMRARMWSCGTEGRLMYENLCEHAGWQQRLMDLAPYEPIKAPRVNLVRSKSTPCSGDAVSRANKGKKVVRSIVASGRLCNFGTLC